MVFCGLPGESLPSPRRAARDNDYYSFESECGSEPATLVLEDEARSYYNLTATLPSPVSELYFVEGELSSERRFAHEK